MKNAQGLVEYAKAQLGLPYWYGTYGQTASAALYTAKKKQYPKYYAPWNDFSTQYGKRVHDCVGLIKGYLWSSNVTAKPKYNGSQDVSANRMKSKCKEKGPINNMPDIPGVLVFMPGHVGVYIGDGYVIEARGHQYGVVKTKLTERPWKEWGKCPFIEYQEPVITAPDKTIKINCKQVKLKPGNWNVRKLPSTDSPVVVVLKDRNEIKVAKGWVYIPSYDGFISEKAIDRQ